MSRFLEDKGGRAFPVVAMVAVILVFLCASLVLGTWVVVTALRAMGVAI